ncbi:hypothetical protein [Janthinobacterium fluminis]|uniref:Uncharacterized protein n=1 Tax=Janthinobacterium fluminis TaxID=2987524 RepID=A0ABT5JW55_9BURK|nr:hypothetical protein [Janthinobacterium fluminis]MDC8756660.1 hypothetical protein [Janthinobacterium fluminis]
MAVDVPRHEGVVINMKRKFVTEYGIGYQNSFTGTITAHQLLRGGEMDAAIEDKISKCHIYAIAARPLPYFNSESLVHKDDVLSGEICYRIDGAEHCVHFDQYRWELEDDAIKIDCKYPYREIRSLNVAGKEVTYLPASYLASALMNHGLIEANDLANCEVLYIGQALGVQGNRSALERLKSHSTFQKILALTNHDCPDKEIMIFMYQFDHEQMLTSIDGRAKDADDSDENENRLMNAMRNPPDKKQKIGMIEAALIRYFQPPYNEIFKIKFPSVKHKILKSCYALDITSLVVELDSTDLNCSLYSQSMPSKRYHIAKVDLVAMQDRHSFFSLTGFPNIPGVIR